MADHLPYLSAPGSLNTALKKIKEAKTPERFTRDFLHTVLDMKGGSANAVIPYLKKVGFLNTDGTPTALYDQFRNPETSGTAVAAALRQGYERLFTANQYAHKLSDAELRGLIVQVTGAEKGSSVVKHTLNTFKNLRGHADFEAGGPSTDGAKQTTPGPAKKPQAAPIRGVNLSYTINLHLPSSTNAEVYNALFKSLRDHLLSE